MRSLVIIFLLVVWLGASAEACQCTGDGNGRGNSPCGSEHGDGLGGDSRYRRWCYVSGDGSCPDQMNSVTIPGNYWSYSACYDISQVVICPETTNRMACLEDVGTVVTRRYEASCQCTGDGNGNSSPPCGTEYGDGFRGNREYRRWCYVYGDGSCPDQMNSLQTSRYWSYSACYDVPKEEQDCGCTFLFGYCQQSCTAFESLGQIVTRRYGGGGSGAWRRVSGGRWSRQGK